MTLKKKMCILLAVAAFGVILVILDLGCFYRNTFHIACPGCGMSRALISVLKFNFSDAFYYHPLFPVVPLAVSVFLFYEKLHKALLITLCSITVTAFFAVYIARLLFIEDSLIYILA